MSVLRRIPPLHLAILVTSFAVALLFAGYTNHVWEDYYITYRASKNLATGYGLVFNHGDRLHTFTSPLGVLLPALGSVLTLNRSDMAALWLFRIASAAAFAGAVTLFGAVLYCLHRNALFALLASAWLAFDAKSLDFATNGMETGFLLLFVAWTVWILIGPCSRRGLWLGLAWAGLMWTRPDGFLYIGLLAASAWLFNDAARTGLTRGQWLKIYLAAGLVCSAVYLPWFAGSWLYYGTPIPHTIAAKAAITSDPKTLAGLVRTAVTLPWKLWTAGTPLPDAFLPSYHMMGGWPAILLPVAKFLAFLAAFAWLAPRVDRFTRALSLTFFGLHVYLSYYPYFPFPWYLPGTTILGYLVIANLIARVAGLDRPGTDPSLANQRGLQLAVPPTLLVLAFGMWISFSVARQLAAQQRWIEDGNRRKIGEWLHAQSAPGDRVFVEPLGYIGYFSGLKTYDYPGMSSREVVDAVRRIGPDWARLIDYLGPEWVVLRPSEADRVKRTFPFLLSNTYHEVREFSVLEDVQKLSVAGRPYLEFDARFLVFRRERPSRFVTDLGEFHTRYPASTVTIDQRQLQLVHAPSSWILAIPINARHVHIAFGFPPGAYAENPKTDGATFVAKIVDGPHEQIILSRDLDPVNRAADRGLQNLDAEIPPHSDQARLHLVTSTGPTDTKDWTSWARPEFW